LEAWQAAASWAGGDGGSGLLEQSKRPARHATGGPAVPSLRAFHHSTNIGSRIDLIDDLEAGENLPRRKLFDFLLVQAVEPITERPLVRSDAFSREAW
jgi:hypothetical protein